MSKYDGENNVTVTLPREYLKVLLDELEEAGMGDGGSVFAETDAAIEILKNARDARKEA